MRAWTLPHFYSGEHWDGWMVAGSTRTRDSDCLEESNFHTTVKMLGGESDDVQIVREGHWACGWVEWIAVKGDSVAKLADIDQRLESYPILDDEDFSQREDDACKLVWETCYSTPKQRAAYLRRKKCILNFRWMRAACKGDWWSACQVLDDPSAIIR